LFPLQKKYINLIDKSVINLISPIYSPQGLCFFPPNCLAVCDTENHLLRKIDLDTQSVSTLAGIGIGKRSGATCQQDFEGGRPGLDQDLSSPWDVCLGRSPSCSENDTLYIAMAGSHQVWAYALQTSTWKQVIQSSATKKSLLEVKKVHFLPWK